MTTVSKPADRLNRSGAEATALDAGDLREARKRLLTMHYESSVGHIGGNLSALDAMMVLHHEIMRPDDRFVLSKGHAAGALYVTLWSLGRLSDADLETFHGENTMLPGHPPARGLDGVLFGTGSLGHGVPLAAGLALAARLRGTGRRIYCLASDGEWEEGSNWEALIFAAHHRLSALTVLVDVNGLQGFGTTDEVASLEPLADKFAGFAVEVTELDGHDLQALHAALTVPEVGKPRILLMRTRKGAGVSFMHDKMEWHYLPMSEEQYRQAIQEIDEAPGE